MARILTLTLNPALDLTVELSVLTAILGLTCGALGAAARMSRLAILRWIAAH